jgi:cytochrome c-type biogenesis protein CcmF
MAKSLFTSLGLSLLFLTYLHLVDRFDVLSVFLTSHEKMPIFYKIVGVWGGYEGSLLLFAFLLSVCPLLSRFLKDTKDQCIFLSTYGFLLTGLLVVIIVSSNPFAMLEVAPTRGMGLNPLLQDEHMGVHPPSLYFGYTLTSIISVMALMHGLHTRLRRLFIHITWLMLSVGIVLGSRWAYYELGWGGFWFWDPVENISLMPWLLLSLLLHLSPQIQSSQRLWANLYTIISLALFPVSLWGVVLSRSGLLQSVHTFGMDARKALFLGVYVVCVSIFFVIKGRKVCSNPYGHASSFTVSSKEASARVSFIRPLFTSVFLIIFSVVVIGTLGGVFMPHYTIEATFYNKLLLPVMLVALGGMAWVITQKNSLYTSISFFIGSLGIGAYILVYFIPIDELYYRPLMSLSLLLTIASAFYTLLGAKKYLTHAQKIPMLLAHLGVSLALSGALASSFEHEEFYAVQPKERIFFKGHTLTIIKEEVHKKSNHEATVLHIRNTTTGDLMSPERRYYWTQKKTHYEGVYAGVGLHHVHAFLGDNETHGRYTLMLKYLPFMRVLWAGLWLCVLAGVLRLILWLGQFIPLKKMKKV